MPIISDFIAKVQAAHKTGNATEHSYRSAFEALFAALDPEVAALNEPKRVKCGAPDFIVFQGDLGIGHVRDRESALFRHLAEHGRLDHQPDRGLQIR